MRLSITTQELVACLSRPALRALREVGTSLGAPVSEGAPGRGEETLAALPVAPPPAHEASASGAPLTGMPEEPVPTASSAPPADTSLPASARDEVAPPPTKRLVRILPRSMRREVPSSAPEVQRAEAMPSARLPPGTREVSSSAPEVPRAEGTSSAYLAPGTGPVPSSVPEVPRSEGARVLPPAAEGASRPVPAPPRAASPVLALRPGRRPTEVSPLEQTPGHGPGVELLPEALPVRAATAAPSSPERVEASRPRTRLVFLPGPAAPGPSSPSSVPRSGPTPALAQQVARGLTPIWDEAYRLTHEALTAVPPSPPARAEVKNTFNVHVHLEPGGGGAVPDRTHLEDSLVDILRDAARRHGLEV